MSDQTRTKILGDFIRICVHLCSSVVLISRMADDELTRIGEELALLEGIRTTRAMRRLKPDPLPRALIREVCAAGTFASSGAMLPVGWPRGLFWQPPRRPVDECLRRERFE
jgi:hypothetical protein